MAPLRLQPSACSAQGHFVVVVVVAVVALAWRKEEEESHPLLRPGLAKAGRVVLVESGRRDDNNNGLDLHFIFTLNTLFIHTGDVSDMCCLSCTVGGRLTEV